MGEDADKHSGGHHLDDLDVGGILCLLPNQRNRHYMVHDCGGGYSGLSRGLCRYVRIRQTKRGFESDRDKEVRLYGHEQPRQH